MLRLRRAIGVGDGWAWWPGTGRPYWFVRTTTASGWRVEERMTGRTLDVCSLKQGVWIAYKWHEASEAEKKVLDRVAAVS